MPDISVIVPVYNVEPYLVECMDSLISQTYQNIEFICINDGSTDHSLDILHQYAVHDARIRVINKANEGYGKTVNRGLELASSPWIGIVESDDFVKSEMFEMLYAAVKDSDADLVKCNFYKYRENECKDISYSKEYPSRLFGKEFCPLEEPEIYDAHCSIWAGLYRKTFLDHYKIRFHETSGASFQDISFQFKVLSSVKKMKLIEDALIYYRTDNIHSSVYDPDKIFCISDEMHFIEEYVQDQPQERQEVLWPIFMRKKFYDYRWNYFRLAPEFQYAFLRMMSEEFRIDYEKGRFDRMRWTDEHNKKELYEMMENPVSFFKSTINKSYVDERIMVVGTMNNKIYLKGLMQEIEESALTVIYGAGVWGKWVAEKMLEQGITKEKLMFAVSQEGASGNCMGIPIKGIKTFAKERKLFVIIAVKGESQIEMLGNLQRLGIRNVILTDDAFIKAIQQSG